MQKKRYVPPTLTELGEVVEETEGTWGGYWESFGTVWRDGDGGPGGDGGGDDDDDDDDDGGSTNN